MIIYINKETFLGYEEACRNCDVLFFDGRDPWRDLRGDHYARVMLIKTCIERGPASQDCLRFILMSMPNYPDLEHPIDYPSNTNEQYNIMLTDLFWLIYYNCHDPVLKEELNYYIGKNKLDINKLVPDEGIIRNRIMNAKKIR